MKQATTRNKQGAWPGQVSRRLREGALILCSSFAIYLLIALITYNDGDPAWSHSGMSQEFQNAAGRAGAWFSDVLFSLFGYLAYSFPVVLVCTGLFVYKDFPLSKDENSAFMWSVRGLGLLLALAASCGLTALHSWQDAQPLPMSAGGLLGSVIKSAMVGNLNAIGSAVILIALLLIGVNLFSGFSWLTFVEKIGEWGLQGLHRSRTWLFPWLRERISEAAKTKLPVVLQDISQFNFSSVKPKDSQADKVEDDAFFAEEEQDSQDIDDIFGEPFPDLNKKAATKPPAQKPTPVAKPVTPSAPPPVVSVPEADFIVTPKKPRAEPAMKFQEVESAPAGSFGGLPPLSLLEAVEKAKRQGFSAAQLQELSRLVETRLLEFGVEVKVVGVLPGPVITRFELDLAAGIKVSKITGLAKDLARSLSVISVRVVEVIPGKSVVGLEIPNVHREIVKFKEVLEDGAYQQSASPISLALGKDIAGRPMVVDLAKMPHLLVAGTTGSGKSVGLNAMLLSILFKSSPEEVRLIMIDPKMLELAVYDHIPHLLTPVVTDMKDAANALRWCVCEMERRYQLMAAVGVRNLAGYNQKVAAAIDAGEPLLDPFWVPQMGNSPDPLEKLPFIVVVVDEFADMMMVVGKKVEELIARIAQKARAAGIHLILATQRPSVDVITGLIKANIPTRIAFQVSSRIDSRTIIDQSGAEQLLGHGDMLYLPPGTGVPHRIHGAFVSDDEVHKVCNALRKSGKPTYIESVVQSTVSTANNAEGGEEVDELYDHAVAVVTEARKASISLVQRRLKIGYNRAARLVEQMEAEGVVSSVQSNGVREVLAPPQVQ